MASAKPSPLAGAHSLGRDDQVRTAEFNCTCGDPRVVQLFRLLGLGRRERGQIGGTERVHLRFDFRLVKAVRDLIPQLVRGIYDLPNRRLYVWWSRSLALLCFLVEAHL